MLGQKDPRSERSRMGSKPIHSDEGVIVLKTGGRFESSRPVSNVQTTLTAGLH